MKERRYYLFGMERIGTREMECFVAVAEELSFVRAAARLHLSQPPLSRHIQALEGKLGVKLLARNTQAVSLTPPGALFLDDAREVLRRIDRAAEGARRAGEGEITRFTVGFAGATLEDRMTRLLRRFRRAQSGVQVRLHERNAPDLLGALREREIDGAFIGTAPAALPKGLRLVPWRREPVWIVLPREHRLAGRPRLSLRELAEEAWIVLAREAAPAYHRQFLRWCQEAGFRPRVTAESQRVAAVLAMVAVGEGVSLLADATVRAARNSPELVFRSLHSPADAVLAHVFACREDDPSPVLRDFVRMLEGEAKAAPTKKEPPRGTAPVSKRTKD